MQKPPLANANLLKLEKILASDRSHIEKYVNIRLGGMHMK